MTDFVQWEGFQGRIWKEEVNTRDFIQKNYRPYSGDESFLAGPTEATDKLWGALQVLQKEERAKGGVLDMETEVVSGMTAYGPGYISEDLKNLEKVVGLQTDKPLKRAFMPYGGFARCAGRWYYQRVLRCYLHHMAPKPAKTVPHTHAAGLGIPDGRHLLCAGVPPVADKLRTQRGRHCRYCGGRAHRQRAGVQLLHERRQVHWAAEIQPVQLCGTGYGGHHQHAGARFPLYRVGRHRLCLHLFDAGAAVHQQRKAGQKRCKRMITGQVSTKAAETV